MQKHIMVDIETTGIDPAKEDLLQIGLLELVFDGEFWLPGKTLEIIQHTDRAPESEFAKREMRDLYEKCRAAPKLSAEEIREQLLEFFVECKLRIPDVFLMGWNATNFDIPFLIAKGCLVPSSYVTGRDGKDTRIGDFHYRVYEISGAVALAQNVMGYPERKQLLADAKEAFPMKLPERQAHDALYDCYSQTQLLNGLIALARWS